VTLVSLGEIARRRGDFPRSAERLGEALEIVVRLGDQGVVGIVLQVLARLEHDRSRPGRAARLWGAGTRLQDEWGVSTALWTYDEVDVSELPANALAAGAAMDLDEAVAYALESARA
jgi:hypothetical protein